MSDQESSPFDEVTDLFFSEDEPKQQQQPQLRAVQNGNYPVLRLYSTDRLLYVTRSFQLQKLQKHSWWTSVIRIDISWHPTPGTAEDDKQMAINNENAAWNIRGNEALKDIS